MPTLPMKNYMSGSSKRNIQSIVFDREYFGPVRARNWVKRHGFITDGEDLKTNTIRFRQKNPQKNKKYRYKTITEGVKFVLEY